jgi:tRNA threonylcarbamoyladenosine biosynthesis protein TsaE
MLFVLLFSAIDMKELKVVCNNIADLPAAAQALLGFVANNRVIAFYGNMGAGKTTFIKEICAAMGVQQHVSSPTFALVNEYIAVSGPVYHFDFYRIKSETEAMDIGCEEYFYSGCFCLVEWPEKVINLLPKETVSVFIEVGENEERIMNYKL